MCSDTTRTHVVESLLVQEYYKGSHSIAMCAFCAFVMAPPKTLLVRLALASFDEVVVPKKCGFPFVSVCVVSSIFVEASKDDDLEDNTSSRSFNWPNFSFLCASMRFFPYASFAFLFAFSAVDGSYVFRVALATMSMIWLFEFVAAKTNAWFTGNAGVDDDSPRVGGCCTGSFRRCCCC